MVDFIWRERWFDRRCFRSPNKDLFAVWVLRCISRLMSSLVSSDILGTQNLLRLQSVCRRLPRFASRHESFYHSRPQSYMLSFVHLFLALLRLLLFPMLSNHLERLTDDIYIIGICE
jgi:hypothetical protein